MTESQLLIVKEIYSKICRKFNLDKETEKLSWDLLVKFYEKLDNVCSFTLSEWYFCKS